MTSITIYDAGDLVLVAFPHTVGTVATYRPALVIVDNGDSDVLLARVTTQIHQSPYDILISDWRGAGLLAPSVLRLHKLATLEKSLVRRRLGSLQRIDRSSVSEAFGRMLGNW
ncbi:MAG: hypothetical protein BZY88_07580 [SAR202 cluster bacterium Io17-Chloro-G9]|nr:MAG: hypothetical protein BZY88_07580 [SAR202 cluster bacterium Io17-Chloro-G9]